MCLSSPIEIGMNFIPGEMGTPYSEVKQCQSEAVHLVCQTLANTFILALHADR